MLLQSSPSLMVYFALSLQDTGVGVGVSVPLSAMGVGEVYEYPVSEQLNVKEENCLASRSL
jgi:hypothetical protein